MIGAVCLSIKLIKLYDTPKEYEYSKQVFLNCSGFTLLIVIRFIGLVEIEISLRNNSLIFAKYSDIIGRPRFIVA